MIGLFLLIHFRHIPVSWGDVSQALIYHQVRKYLLRLENVQLKYWRPQILLLTVNPRTSFEALRFANDMKKGGLYIVGRVLVGEMNRRTAKRQAELQKASVMNPPPPTLLPSYPLGFWVNSRTRMVVHRPIPLYDGPSTLLVSSRGRHQATSATFMLTCGCTFR